MSSKCEHDQESPAFIQFVSHNEAYNALHRIGYTSVDSSVELTPREITDSLASMLDSQGFSIMNMTNAIPDTPHAAYKALTIAGFQAAAACRKDRNAAFLIIRTAANTPSFLFGHHWNLVQTLGHKVADENVHSSSTPGLILIFREKQMCIPTSVCLSNLSILTRLMAMRITENSDFFACCFCKKGFIKNSNDVCINVSEVGMSPSGQLFHRDCAMHCIERGEDVMFDTPWMPPNLL